MGRCYDSLPGRQSLKQSVSVLEFPLRSGSCHYFSSVGDRPTAGHEPLELAIQVDPPSVRNPKKTSSIYYYSPPGLKVSLCFTTFVKNSLTSANHVIKVY